MQQIAKKELTRFSLIIFVFFLSILASGLTVVNFVFAEIQSQPKPSIEKTEIRFTKTLWRSSRGDDVKRLQEFLKKSPDIYPEGLVTGYFGPLTEKAVKKLQEKYGIETVGIVGPKTRQKLNELFVTYPKIIKLDEKIVKPEEKKEVFQTPQPSRSVTEITLSKEESSKLFDWLKGQGITLKGTAYSPIWYPDFGFNYGTSGPPRPYFNPVIDSVEINNIPYVHNVIKDLQLLPPHLLEFLRGDTYYLSLKSDECGPWGSFAFTPEVYLINGKLGPDFNRKDYSYFTQVPDWICNLFPCVGYWEPKDVPQGYVSPLTISMCAAPATLHEVGHLIDYHGIRMRKGREFTIGKTDEKIRELAEEYLRVFKIPVDPVAASKLQQPPPGYLATYMLSAIDEIFALHFDHYISNPQSFRERAAKDSGLAEKYEFLKTKIFLGREY